MNNPYKDRRGIIPPELEWTLDYAKIIGLKLDSPEYFFDHYESIGWVRGKNPIRDWCATMRTWRSNRKDGGEW